MLDDELHADRCGQVDHHIALVREFVDDLLVEHGTVHKAQPWVEPDAIKVGEPASRQVIEGNHRVATGQQCFHQV